MSRLSIVPDRLSITMESRKWLILMGVLAGVQDSSGVINDLAMKIMDEIE